MNPRIWRIVAIVIALAAFVDPGLTRNTSTRPVVSIVAARSSDRAAANDVVRELRRDFTVVDGAFPAAAATVIVGDRMPASFGDLPGPAFAVTPDSAAASLTIVDVAAPVRAPLNSRVRIAVDTRARGGRGDSVVVTLTSWGAVIDRAVRAVVTDDEIASVPVWFVPATQGAQYLRVSAELRRAPSRADADVLVEVQPERWPVLFFDRRPSWMSTFVRRSVEGDPRFIVTSRVVTSRNVSTDAGRPPESFDAITAGELFDAVIVGAPELLTDRDVTGLEAFMRRRGGTVVMLFDTRQDGRYEALTQVQRWSTAVTDSATVLTPIAGESGGLKASELAWPAVLPAGAEHLVDAQRAPRDSSRRAIIWRSAVGAGRLIVSGATDAWAYRDTASSRFDEFWRRTIAEAADATPPAIFVRLPRQVVEPEQRMDVDVVVREAASSTDPVTVTAVFEPGEMQTPMRLWPTSTAGVYHGSVRAPSKGGVYRLVATSGVARGDAAFAVEPDASAPAPLEDDLVSTWIASRRGGVVSTGSLSRLSGMLQESVVGKKHAERWFPMRSAWWIIPFALALGAEWWWRRRRGLA